MQNDEMIWQVIGHQFCSFKTKIGTAKSDKKEFCKHPYSITGLCNRSHCPLANSRYAVVRESEGKINLFIKTVERAHSPKNLWERIALSRNYARAIEQLDEHLAYFPKALVHRNKQRLTKIHQYLIRMRKIKLKERDGKKARMMTTNKKIDVREDRRERKALVAAKVEQNIEKELLERLAKGAYGDIYNFPEVPYQKTLEEADELEEEEESSEEEDELVEYVEGESEDEEEDEEVENMKYIGEGKWTEDDGSSSDEDESSNDSSSEDDEESDSDEESDDELKKKKGKKRPAKRKRGTRVEIEYEEEQDDSQELELQQENIAGMAW